MFNTIFPKNFYKKWCSLVVNLRKIDLDGDKLVT
jgi:hypothetical protein